VTPLQTPEGQQVFAQAFTPTDADFDANGHVNNVVYVRWIQDIATAHWRARTAGEPEIERWAWVVLRHEIDYRRALLPGETAQGRTWVGERRGPRFIRYVRIDGPDGEMCAQAVTDWCLIDSKSGRPTRVPDWMVERLI
jgi:acyl-CoA thioester hydrolase